MKKEEKSKVRDDKVRNETWNLGKEEKELETQQNPEKTPLATWKEHKLWLKKNLGISLQKKE